MECNPDYGLKILLDMTHARRFNKWMAHTLSPYIGGRVLEVGAGIGTLTNHFIPRELYVASDINRHALDYLKSYATDKPYLSIKKINADSPEDFFPFKNQFDTVLMINVLEHVSDEQQTLSNIRTVLKPGGRVVVLVPQNPALYGSLDRALDHRERYTREKLKKALVGVGFRINKIFDFNRFTVPSWFINGKILKTKRFSLIQLRALEFLMPILQMIDRVLPWEGLSLIAVGVKERDIE